MTELTLNRGMLDQVYFVPPLGLAYVTNPKAACTAVKLALWRRADALNGTPTFGRGMNPHSIADGPWLKPEQFTRAQLESAAFFTVVRDPHVRLLSAYLNKKDNPREPFWKWCQRRFGHVPPTFKEFISRLVEVPEQQRDRHVRPQWINVLWPWVRYDFVGRVENMEVTQRFLDPYGLVVRHPKWGRTNASDQLDAHYDEDTRSVVSQAYADDLQLWRGELPPATKTVLGDLLTRSIRPARRSPDGASRNPGAGQPDRLD